MTNPDRRDFTRQELAGTLISLGEKGSKADRIFRVRCGECGQVLILDLSQQGPPQ